MAENSAIEWTDHTFNMWRGCQKVSDGCKNCYAETLSKRNPGVLGEWGPNGKRVIAAESYWRLPVKWNRDAEKAGERRRVFCASLADVFEDMPELVEPRFRLLELIYKTPYLDWLLLTKRPQNVMSLVEEAYEHGFGEGWQSLWAQGEPPANVWLGTSVENQQAADDRIPALLEIPAAVRFLSCEPLLGAVDLNEYLGCGWDGEGGWRNCPEHLSGRKNCSGVDWCIVGGESGPNARPMHPDWAQALRDQCVAADVPFLFKQWGESVSDKDKSLRSSSGNAFWMSPDGTVGNRQPEPINCEWMARVGKKAAGRLLDGRTWDEFPEVDLEEDA